MKRGVYRLTSLVWLMALSRVFAAGLGDIEVQSKLGESLVARVPILGLSASEADQVQAQLAPLKIYRQQGVEFPAVLHSVSTQISTQGDQVYLTLTSSQRINEPILDLLLQVAAPNGDIQRQFTLLLDLPSATPPDPTPRVIVTHADEPSTLQDNRDSTLPNASPVATSTAATVAINEQTPVVTSLKDGQYGPVKRRETLWLIAKNIASQVQQSQARVMAGLFKENPLAFLKANPDYLMEGSLLRLPTQWPSESLAQLRGAAHTSAPALTASVSNTAPPVVPTINAEASANVNALSEQNRQLRGEISDLSVRIADLENRLRQQTVTSPLAPSNATLSLPVNDNVVVPADTQVQAISAPIAATELNAVPLAKKMTPASAKKPVAVVKTTKAINPIRQVWPWLIAGLIVASVVAFFWLHRNRKPLQSSLLDESLWQERKRSARATRHAERNIPTPQDWHSTVSVNDAPNVAESMDIKLQYVRSAVDTFLLFQRYNEALAFIRREIFEAGHDSALGHRLDGLYRETKDHLHSLGIDETLPTGEAKIELASARREIDDKQVVTPLRKTRPPNRRDLI